MHKEYTVACYYFPNYHVDVRNEAAHGSGWTEWALVKARLVARPDQPKIMTINAWNEWTEGSYLEPDTVQGLGYLAAIQATFGG